MPHSCRVYNGVYATYNMDIARAFKEFPLPPPSHLLLFATLTIFRIPLLIVLAQPCEVHTARRSRIRLVASLCVFPTLVRRGDIPSRFLFACHSLVFAFISKVVAPSGGGTPYGFKRGECARLPHFAIELLSTYQSTNTQYTCHG